MVNMKKSKKLEKGDKIGLIAPASKQFTKKEPSKVMERTIKFFEEEMKLKTELSKNFKGSFGYLSGTIEERVSDINDFFRRDDVKAISCMGGGHNSNSLLPHLDYDMIRENPKPFFGTSDATALNMAITKKSKIVTYLGTQRGIKRGRGIDYSKKYLKKAVFSSEPIGKIEEPEEIAKDGKSVYRGGNGLVWIYEKENPSEQKERRYIKKYEKIRGGKAEGVTKGGYFDLLTFLAGTEYMPNFEDSIMLLDDMGYSSSYVESRLEKMDQLGILEKINGMIYARPCYMTIRDEDRTFKHVLKEYADKWDYPVFIGPDFGHSYPRLTVPIGVKARMNADKKLFELIESGVY